MQYAKGWTGGWSPQKGQENPIKIEEERTRAMAWIELHDNLPDHPKTLAVARALDMDKDMVVGKLCRLWTWCLANREDGLLALEDGETLCEVMRFTGGAKKLMQALCTPPKGGEAGFIEPTPGGYRLHGWEERTSLLMETRARKRAQTMERTRRYRERRKEQVSQGGGDGDAVGDAAVTRHGDAGCDAAVTQCDVPTEPNPTEPYPTEPNPLGGIPPREVRGKGREQEGPPVGACAGQTEAGRQRDRAEAQARRTLEDGGAGAYEAREAGGSAKEQREESGHDEGTSECEPMRAENKTPVNSRLPGQRAAHERCGEAGRRRDQELCGPDRRARTRTDVEEPDRTEQEGVGQEGVGICETAREAEGQREQGGRWPDRRDCVQADMEKPGRPERGGAGAAPHGGEKEHRMPFALEAGAVFTLPARGGEVYVLDAAQIGQLQAAYPELDLAGELRAMDSWLRANPQGVRPAGMMSRFVDGWLRNAQKRVCRPVARGDTVERFLALAQQMERET